MSKISNIVVSVPLFLKASPYLIGDHLRHDRPCGVGLPRSVGLRRSGGVFRATFGWLHHHRPPAWGPFHTSHRRRAARISRTALRPLKDNGPPPMMSWPWKALATPDICGANAVSHRRGQENCYQQGSARLKYGD